MLDVPRNTTSVLDGSFTDSLFTGHGYPVLRRSSEIIWGWSPYPARMCTHFHILCCPSLRCLFVWKSCPTRIPRRLDSRRALLHPSSQWRRVQRHCVQHPPPRHGRRSIVAISISDPVVSNYSTSGELLCLEVTVCHSCFLNLEEYQSHSRLDLSFRNVCQWWHEIPPQNY